MNSRKVNFVLGLLLIVITPSIADVGSTNGANSTVEIAVLLPMSEHFLSGYAHRMRDVINMAAEAVNANNSVLPDYSINLNFKDTKGLAGQAVIAFMELVQTTPSIVALLGPTLSSEAFVVGQITPYVHLVQMLYSTRSASFARRDHYSSIYMTNYMDDAANPGKIALAKYFRWSKIATISMIGDVFTSQIENLHELLRKHNLSLVTSGVLTSIKNIPDQIARFKHYNARIIVAALTGEFAAAVFCEAYKQNMFGRKYVWIISKASLYSGWETRFSKGLSCTPEQIYRASSGHFSVGFNALRNDETILISGETTSEVLNKIQTRLGNRTIPRSAPWAYDSVWSLGLALDATVRTLPFNITLSDAARYGNTIRRHLQKNLEAIAFEGLSGPVSYGSDGRRRGITYIYHITDGVEKTVAHHDQSTEGDVVWLVDPKSLWEDGVVPRDAFLYVIKFQRLNIIAVAVTMTLNVIGISGAVGFLVFNVKYRDRRLIKMSSPAINNVIAVGGIVTYLSVFLCSTDYWFYDTRTIPGICMIRAWVMSIGFTLAFGSIFSKIWRVYVLFRDIHRQKKAVKDWHVLGVVCSMIMVDIIILVPWTVAFPLVNTQVSDMAVEEHETIVTGAYMICSHPQQTYWYAVLYTYKGLLLVFGTFLAWETRRVTIPALNDSRYIGFCVYNVIIICIFGVPVYHVLAVNQHNLRYIISNVFTIFCTSLVLCIVFIPKIVLMSKNDHRNTMFLHQSGVGTERANSVSLRVERSARVQPYNGDMGDGSTRLAISAESRFTTLEEENENLRGQLQMELGAIRAIQKTMETQKGMSLNKIGNSYTITEIVSGNPQPQPPNDIDHNK